jgi:uncharacterized membrane protein YphA (DoxX/SURF4 family)
MMTVLTSAMRGYDRSMDLAVVAARVMLASVFGVAAMTKLRDRGGTAATFTEFGVAPGPAGLLARILPLAELAIAAALLIPPAATAAAVAAAVLLAGFTLGIITALRHDKRPDCGCFGNLSSKPISSRTAVRNLALLALALFIALEGIAQILAAIAVAVAALSLLFMRRLEPAVPATPDSSRTGVERGSAAPDFERSIACGGAGSLESLRARGKPVVLIFLDSGCGACSELHPHLRRWQDALGERVVISVVMAGDADMAHRLCRDYEVEDVFVDTADEPVWKSYRVPSWPSAVAVSADGSIASSPVFGKDAIEELVRQTIRPDSQTAQAWNQASPVA